MRCFLLSAACLMPLSAFAAIQVALTPSVPSPQVVGTKVVWTATATDTQPGLLNYRFKITNGSSTLTARDFSQANTLDWAANLLASTYEIKVTVRNNSTGETVDLSAPFVLNPLTTSNSSVAVATSNPLVALFSAPPCAPGSNFRVKFQTSGQVPQFTNWRKCLRGNNRMNAYVAGMRPQTSYVLTAQVASGAGTTEGNRVPFLTGAGSPNLPTLTIPRPGDSQTSALDGVILWDFINIGAGPGFPVASDLKGRVLWYYPAFDDPDQAGGLLTRYIDGGTMLVLSKGVNSSNSNTRLQVLREIDLAGNTIRETNAGRISEQLAAKGLPSSCTSGSSVCAFGAFHHDAIRLPNGHTLVLGDIERIYPAGTQGSTGPVDIIGDLIVDLDPDFQVAWYWDSFAHLDVNQKALQDEKCTPDSVACPPLFLSDIANDWMHANSLNYTPDKNILLSIRHLDQVIKIDYRDGAGNGNVLWRLGTNGDFAIVSSDPSPWFSHQHDVEVEADGRITLFDNGNARYVQNPVPSTHSRGQAYVLDEVNKIATLVLNADLGVYSFAVGSGQLLQNGDFSFLAGIVNPGPGVFSQSIETLPNGQLNITLQSTAAAYRSTRLNSLYQARP